MADKFVLPSAQNYDEIASKAKTNLGNVTENNPLQGLGENTSNFHFKPASGIRPLANVDGPALTSDQFWQSAVRLDAQQIAAKRDAQMLAIEVAVGAAIFIVFLGLFWTNRASIGRVIVYALGRSVKAKRDIQEAATRLSDKIDSSSRK